MAKREIDIDNDGTADFILESTHKNCFQQLRGIFASLAIAFIAIGQWNDAIDVISKVYNIAYSKFTDNPSRKKLDAIYIRASAKVLEENLGVPVYIKRTSDGHTIQYYKDEHFILSAITKDKAISAYLVFPLKGFQPDTENHAGGKAFLNNAFSMLENVSSAHSNFSRSISYYIEEEQGGVYKFLYSSIGGFSAFDTGLTEKQATLLSNFSDAQMLGGNETQTLQALRSQMKPNFYGYSKLGLKSLEDAILTNSEYQLILGR